MTKFRQWLREKLCGLWGHRWSHPTFIPSDGNKKMAERVRWCRACCLYEKMEEWTWNGETWVRLWKNL